MIFSFKKKISEGKGKKNQEKRIARKEKKMEKTRGRNYMIDITDFLFIILPRKETNVSQYIKTAWKSHNGNRDQVAGGGDGEEKNRRFSGLVIQCIVPYGDNKSAKWWSRSNTHSDRCIFYILHRRYSSKILDWMGHDILYHCLLARERQFCRILFSFRCV